MKTHQRSFGRFGELSLGVSETDRSERKCNGEALRERQQKGPEYVQDRLSLLQYATVMQNQGNSPLNMLTSGKNKPTDVAGADDQRFFGDDVSEGNLNLRA